MCVMGKVQYVKLEYTVCSSSSVISTSKCKTLDKKRNIESLPYMNIDCSYLKWPKCPLAWKDYN